MGPWTEWLWWQRREWCKLYFHSPRLTWLQLLLSAGSANSRDQTESQIWHHSSWCPANNLVTGWQYWTNSLVERVNWVSIGVDSYADYGFAFVACNASAKTTIHGLGESLTHHHVIPHSIASDKGTHFTAREVNPLVLQCSPTEATGLIKSCKCILKKQGEYQLGGSILEGWPGFSRRQYLLWINV